MNPIELLQSKVDITNEVYQQIEQHVSSDGWSYEQAFVEAGVSTDVIHSVFSELYGVPAFPLSEDFKIPQSTLDLIPEDSSRHYRVIPLAVEDDLLTVGTPNPDNLQMREALNFISARNNLSYRLVYLTDAEVTTLQKFYENLEGDVTVALEHIESELDAEIAASLEESSTGNDKQVEHIEEDAPVTKIVATILRYAVDGSASDIHIEPSPSRVAVRFRVDGMLATSLELPKNVHMAVVARVKILSSMRLDERRKPQDGRFSATFNNRKIDFRVSILPTNHGEKVVMRILDNERGVHNLDGTGIGDYHLQTIRELVKEPYGIILISGPTGSGKSTTLYSMLAEVDRIGKNVLSLEDPVEYNIEGVSQSQVRPEIGYTFADGLRSALRQDPDIIMVGEIRDRETAQLAIQAALTGHLVLSTIHTNNSIGVIPRLIDMGIPPYLIAPTLKLAIAQRLARKVYPGTGKEVPASNSMQMMMDDLFKTLPTKYHTRIPTNRTVLLPEPSTKSPTGMQGRTAVMELLQIDDEMQELILRNASEEEMFAAVRKKGFMTMQEDAIIKALNHVIPYQEMNAFGTKVGLDVMYDEEVLAVNNVDEVVENQV